MNKRLVVFGLTLAGLFAAPAFGQVAQGSSLEAQEAVRTYDACLTKAMVRAERAGTPLDLRHGVSMRACQGVRTSLLSNAEEGSEMAVVLDAVDRIRQEHIDQSTRAASEMELANLSDVYFMEKVARRIDRETFSPRIERLGTSMPAEPQTPSQ